MISLLAATLLSVVPADAVGYSTELEAAQAGLKVCISKTIDYEYGGAIVTKADGKFYFSEPVTSGDKGRIDEFRLGFHKNETLVAIFHTHPHDQLDAGDNSELVSEADIDTAKKLKVHSYIGIIKNMKVIEYVIGDTTSTMYPPGNVTPKRFSRGHVVGDL